MRNKELQAQRSHEHYQRNKDKVRTRTFEKVRLLKMISNAVKDEPCMDCGVWYPPYVMDFDHRDPSLKVRNPSKIRDFSSAKVFIDELAKCDVVCANCHRIRTADRRDMD